MINDPPWLVTARKYLGTREIPGRASNPLIVRWWKAIRQAISDDGTAWCAAFVGGVLEEVGIRSTRAANARSYLNHGSVLTKPAVGAIVVFARGGNGWSGHVGFVVGRNRAGHLMVLGGNQGDSVRISAFNVDRVLGYRWPTGGVPLPQRFTLPILASDGTLSKDEA
jgi:uncharacterized protein (TIGR02594 family)